MTNAYFFLRRRVLHQVRVTQTLSKDLLVGVIDLAQRESIWLEMGFHGQLVLNLISLQTLLRKLVRFSIGQLLTVKAQAQHLALMETLETNEVYTLTWAQNTAAVTQLLLH